MNKFVQGEQVTPWPSGSRQLLGLVVSGDRAVNDADAALGAGARPCASQIHGFPVEPFSGNVEPFSRNEDARVAFRRLCCKSALISGYSFIGRQDG